MNMSALCDYRKHTSQPIYTEQCYATLPRQISVITVHSNQPNNGHRHFPLSAILSVFIHHTSLLWQPALLYVALRSMRVVGRLPAQTADVLNLKDTQSLNSWQFTCWATQSDWIHSRKAGSLEGFLSNELYLTNLKRVSQWVMQTTLFALLWYHSNALQVFLRKEQREILE